MHIIAVYTMRVYYIHIICDMGAALQYIIHYNILDVYGRGVLLLLWYICFYDGLIHG